MQDLLIQAHAREYLQGCEVRSCLTLKENQRTTNGKWPPSDVSPGLPVDCKTREFHRKLELLNKNLFKSLLQYSLWSQPGLICQERWKVHSHGCRAGENLSCVCIAIYITYIYLSLYISISLWYLSSFRLLCI